MSRRTQWVLGGAGFLLVALFGVVSGLGSLRDKIPLFLALYAGAFALYVAAVFVVLRRNGVTGRWLTLVFAVAALCRIVLIPAFPDLSTDAYRYLWEGRMITKGFNPFSHPPDAPELEFLRDDNYERINHKHLETIYPPVSQAVFALAALVKNDVRTQKALFVLFDLGTILVLMGLLRSRGRDPAAAVIFAWNPLVIFETAHSGHVDAVGIFFLVMGIWTIERRKRLIGFASLGASFLAKYLAAVLAPFFLIKRKHAAWVGVSAVVAVAGYLPFLGAGPGLVSSLGVYGAQWHFNGLLYELFSSFWHDPAGVRLVLALVLVVIFLYHAARQSDVVCYAFVTVGAGLLLAPTLYPWYVSWIVPFLCFTRNRAWILFTGLVFVSYWVWRIFAVEGEWALPGRLYALEYVPFLGLLAYDTVKSRRRRSAAKA